MRYMTRCPFSLSRLVKVTETGQVIYKAEKQACRAFPDPDGDGLVSAHGSAVRRRRPVVVTPCPTIRTAAGTVNRFHRAADPRPAARCGRGVPAPKKVGRPKIRIATIECCNPNVDVTIRRVTVQIGP